MDTPIDLTDTEPQAPPRQPHSKSWHVPAGLALLAISIAAGAFSFATARNNDAVDMQRAAKPSVVLIGSSSRRLLDGTLCEVTLFNVTTSNIIEKKVELCPVKEEKKQSIMRYKPGFAWPGARQVVP